MDATAKIRPKRVNGFVGRDRTESVAGMILDGLSQWEIAQRVRQHEANAAYPWDRQEGYGPLSARQLNRYIETAHALLAVSTAPSTRAELVQKHVNRRNALINRALTQNDLKTAASVLKDLAELQGLYPPAQSIGTLNVSAETKHDITVTHDHVHRLDPTALAAALQDRGLTIPTAANPAECPAPPSPSGECDGGSVHPHRGLEPVDSQADHAAE